jgi:hypothetical protein
MKIAFSNKCFRGRHLPQADTLSSVESAHEERLSHKLEAIS